MFRRVVWIVLDSVGIGEMPDAAAYGDQGSDTLGNLARRRPLQLPNLCRLGLANIKPLADLPPVPDPTGAYGRCALASPGKDTTTGHWEMAGIILERPFPLFPNGFPREFLDAFEQRIGRATIGNRAASGTEIIQQLGFEHILTGSPIVYTSADSVFQIAAHEQVIPLFDLYRICEIAREMLRGDLEVARVIARPFAGAAPGAFVRTPHRHDYAVPPPEGMLLDRLSERGIAVCGVGKIGDIFLGRGITTPVKTKNNDDGITKILEALSGQADGVIFVNLVDFDTLWGHRNDAENYAAGLEHFDRRLPEIEAALGPADLLLLTADHGCDPTTPSTDHSREYVPLLAVGPGVRPGVELGLRASLADIGQTVARNFQTSIAAGTSFLEEITT
jgi:phosphopentomutase